VGVSSPPPVVTPPVKDAVLPLSIQLIEAAKLLCLSVVVEAALACACVSGGREVKDCFALFGIDWRYLGLFSLDWRCLVLFGIV
jgi:hypothetical protein